MYYIVKKESVLYSKFQFLGGLMKEYNKEALDLAKKLGFKSIRQERFKLAGGISSFYSETKPVGFAYAFGSKYPNDFFPKKINANKEILEQIKELPTLEVGDLNELINFDSDKNSPSGKYLFNPGFSIKKDYVLLDLSSAINYKPVKGMTEILTSEYQKLKSKK